MRLCQCIIFIFVLAQGSSLFAESMSMHTLAQKISNPTASLKALEPLVVMGNSSLDAAQIVFLPEIHDDPNSLYTQALLLSYEKQKGDRFIILDESLPSMKKSVWDIFSEKALEIVTADNQRRTQQVYAPRQFENALKNLAYKFKDSPGQLSYLMPKALYTLVNFKDKATPFYGWDTGTKASLTERNIKMVESIKTALQNNKRVFVMAGARHIPELEYMTSQKLLCPEDRASGMSEFFSTIENKFGSAPHLRFGIGATTPIHNFLKNQKYAVVFDKKLYTELESVVQQFKYQGGQSCLYLQ